MSMEWLGEVLMQIKNARLAEEQLNYDKALQLYEQAMKYLACINILKNEARSQEAISTLIHILCGQQLTTIKQLKKSMPYQRTCPITQSSSTASLMGGITQRNASGGINVSHSLPVIRVSEAPNVEYAPMKAKERLPHYNRVVGSILHALNFNTGVSQELYDELMECLINLKKSKAAATKAQNKKAWIQQDLASATETKNTLRVKHGRRLRKVKKFMAKRFKRKSDRTQDDISTCSSEGSTSTYSIDSGFCDPAQVMIKVHSLIRHAQKADLNSKYELALSLYKEAECHFLNTLKYEPSTAIARHNVCVTCGAVLPYSELSQQDFNSSDDERICSQCLAVSCESLLSIKSISLRKVCLLPNTIEGVDIIEGAVEFGDSSVEWCNIAGLHATKQALKNLLMELQYPSDIESKQIRTCKGILLYGPSGTGKTFLANAIANETETDFYYLNLVYFGGYSANCLTILKEVFYQARNRKPAVIFIDEVDMLCSENTRDLRTEFLLQMSGMDGENDAILMLAATKAPWTLDSDVRMCFQTALSTSYPGEESRRNILHHHVGTLKTTLTQGHYHTLARTTRGYSGDDIKRLVREAAMMPIRRFHAATHFKLVWSDPAQRSGSTFLVPCSRRDFGSIEMSWRDVTRGRMIEQPVCMDDFLKAASIVKPTISRTLLKQFDDWGREFAEEQAKSCSDETEHEPNGSVVCDSEYSTDGSLELSMRPAFSMLDLDLISDSAFTEQNKRITEY